MQTNNTKKNALAISQHDILPKIINGYASISTGHEVTEALEQYLQSINTPPQAAPAPLPNAAPPATPGAQPPVQAPPPAAGGGNPNMRANYATMFPNDPVSGLINAQQQQQQQGAR